MVIGIVDSCNGCFDIGVSGYRCIIGGCGCYSGSCAVIVECGDIGCFATFIRFDAFDKFAFVVFITDVFGETDDISCECMISVCVNVLFI